MSWGEPQQPSYDPNNPYGQPAQQPYQQPQPQPQAPREQPGWAQPTFGGGSASGSGFTPPAPAPGPNDYGQAPTNPFEAPGAPFGQQPGYGQPGYGQPEFPQYQAPAPAKKGNGMFVGIVVGALVVVGGGIAAAVVLTGKHNSPSPNPTGSSTVVAAGSLSAPAKVSSLTKLSGSTADKAVSAMKTSLASEKELYPNPVIAAYNDGGGDNMTTILIDQAMSQLSTSYQSQLTSIGSASDIVSEIMTGAGVSDAQSETTSASDGALSCGTKAENSLTATICVWYDGKDFGTLQYFDGTSPAGAAPVADAVRAAAEG